MTATDELRRLLDERGVEWREHHELQGEITLWNGWQFFEGTASYNDGYSMLSMVDATPEQAVEATLGRGTCHDAAGKQMAFFSCSACGATTERKHPRFCFACGRKVVDA